MPLTFLRRIGRLFGSRLLRVTPVKAYDRWAATYDSQPDHVVLAHIRSAAVAIREWHRILRPGGAVLVTDFHPAAIRAGMKRTFDSEGQTIEIEHYATEMEQLRDLVINCGFTAACVTERAIDESVRPLFERARYLKAYKKHK